MPTGSFLTRFRPSDFTFSQNFSTVFQKTHLLFKLIFRETQYQQRPKCDTFQKALFCTLPSSANLELNAVPIAVRQYLWRRFTFFCTKSPTFFWNSRAFLKKQKLKGKFSDILGQNICRIFHILAQSLFTISETGLDYYHQKMNVRVPKRVAKRLTIGFYEIRKFQKNLWNAWIWW